MNNAIRKSDFHIIRNKTQEKEATQIQRPVACALCKDKGFVRANVSYGHPQFGKPIECKCTLAKKKAKQQEELVFSSGILNMSRFRNATFQSFQTNIPGVKIAYSKAVKFADDPDGWLVLVGPYGCGKTHLAAAIARKRIEASDVVLVQTAPDLLDYLRSAFSPESNQSYDERFEAMKKADLLVIDDYGAQTDSPWAMEKVFQLLNYRYNTGAATVITSNGIDGIDPRIYSRLHDQSLVTLVRMDNAGDYRMRGGE